MGGSVNKVILIGCLGHDPSIRENKADGKRVASFSLATSKTIKDGNERRNITTWHKVVVLNDGLAGIVQQFVKKGSRVYVEGEIGVRAYKGRDGTEKTAFEIVIPPFGVGALVLCDRAEREQPPDADSYSAYGQSGSVAETTPSGAYQDDEVPF